MFILKAREEYLIMLAKKINYETCHREYENCDHDARDTIMCLECDRWYCLNCAEENDY